jgi:hypothetical protein
MAGRGGGGEQGSIVAFGLPWLEDVYYWWRESDIMWNT